MNIDLQAVIDTLISSAATHKAKIEKLERDLDRAFREIETLRGSTVSSHQRGET